MSKPVVYWWTLDTPVFGSVPTNWHDPGVLFTSPRLLTIGERYGLTYVRKWWEQHRNAMVFQGFSGKLIAEIYVPRDSDEEAAIKQLATILLDPLNVMHEAQVA